MKVVKYFLCLFLLGMYSLGMSQMAYDFSENTLPVRETIAFRSSALLPKTTSIQVSSIHYTSNAVGVSQYYLLGNYVFGKSKNKTIGLQIHVKDRGNIIAETSSKLSFRQIIPLSTTSKLALSANLGFYQLFLQSTPTTVGGSNQAFNMDWSVGYEMDSWLFSAYLGNPTEPQLQVLNDLIPYEIYYGIYAQKEFFYSSNYEGSIQLNVFQQTNEIQWRTTCELKAYQYTSIGINANLKSIGFYGAFRDWEVAEGLQMHFHAGYAFAISNENYIDFSPLQFQITLAKRNKKD
ncbi:MAG: hypothetical protein GY827_06325 [Cytophagales bacterium]|nr:hypothetical protein [Cytophagales bacterium]